MDGNTLDLISFALIPPFLVVLWFYKKDKNPEPLKHTIKAVLSGVLVCLPVVVLIGPLGIMLEEPLRAYPLVYGFVVAFFLAAIPEEFFKFVFFEKVHNLRRV